jgi:hypothetical protein
MSETTATTRVDRVEVFDALAAAMGADPERYERLGDLDLDLVIRMRREDEPDFLVSLGFHGITCDHVAPVEPDARRTADCWLDGDLAAWEAMFENITSHGHAVDEWTLNTLTLFGERISLHASDPMGEDRFHRFNQTLQEFFDAAARLGPA